MASIYISKPGTKYGPCIEVCEHKDCAALREIVTRRCPYCGAPIGYDRHYYDTSDDGTKAGRIAAGQIEYSHAGCYEDSLSAR